MSLPDVGAMQSLFIMQNYTENANGDMPLTAESVWYFWFSWVHGGDMFFLYKKDF